MSGGAVAIRPARAADASAIVRLVRASFAADVRGAIVYGAAGATSWIRAHLALPPASTERAYTVAKIGRAVIAATDLQRTGDSLLLAYIAVEPGARGRGLAAHLLAAAIDGAATPRHRTFSLDVFADNLIPRRWYSRLGLEEVEETAWWALDPPAPDRAAHPGEITIADYPAAVAAQRTFGFSQFRVTTPRATYVVGRIGPAWFRLTDPAAAGDAALVGTLAAIDPARRLLVLGPRKRPPGAMAGRPIAVSVRMSAPLAEVRSRLGARLPAASAPAPATLNT